MATYYFRSVGGNWRSATPWSDTPGGSTSTTIGSTGPTVNDDVIFDSNSGNCTVTSGSVCKSVDFRFYTNTLTMTSGLTVSTNVIFGTSMIITGTGSLTINGTGYLESNGKVWPNALSFTTSGTTKTFVGDLTVNGLLTISNVTITPEIVKTPNAKIIANNGLLMGGVNSIPTFAAMPIYVTGGTVDINANSNINLFIDGNSSPFPDPPALIINKLYMIGGPSGTYPATITYVSGNVDAARTTSEVRVTNTCNFNTGSDVVFRIITSIASGSAAVILSGDKDLHVNILSIYKSSTATINKTTNEKVYVYQLFVPCGPTGVGGIQGNADIYLKGAAFWCFDVNMNILTNDVPTCSSNIYLDGGIIKLLSVNQVGGSINYISGIVDASELIYFSIGSNVTLKGFNKIPLKNVRIVSGANITMDEFFTGTANQYCKLNETGPYTVTFTDNFERIAKFVSVNRCTVSGPGLTRQPLIVLTNKKLNTETSTGIKYKNVSPNGFSKNTSFQFSKETGLPGGLVGDPNFTK